MDDQELLEMAAKAAGIPKHMLYDSIGDNGGIEEKGWNPLEDDGDAFRLAEALSFGIDIEKEATGVLSRDNKVCIIDKCKRRAIVRAAAEIGSKMQ